MTSLIGAILSGLVLFILFLVSGIVFRFGLSKTRLKRDYIITAIFLLLVMWRL